MTEEEAKQALFEIHLVYMTHTPQERLELYDEYKANRDKIKKELAKAKLEKLRGENKSNSK